jgi:hypothetical protein
MRLMPRKPRWYQHYPEEVSEVEALPFQQRTAAERTDQQARRRLESYGWVERGRVIHVPIALAIEVYLREQEENRR